MKKTNFASISIVIFYVIVFLISLISAILEDSDTNLNPFDYARITDVDYKAEVTDTPNGNGKIIVTEKLTFDIHAASDSNHFYELWRALPENYVDGVKTSYKVNYVKELFPDGTSQWYSKSPKLYWDDSDYISPIYGPGKWFHSPGPYDEDARRYECVLMYVDKYREKSVFEIQYEMENAALRYNDCSELYLSLYSEETIKYLKSFKAQILFPNNLMPDEDNYYAHTYGTNSNEFKFKTSDTLNPGYTTFYFNLGKSELKFSPYNQYIEFALVSYGNDKHKFTKYASKNDYYYTNVLDEIKEEQEKYEKTPLEYGPKKTIAFVICIISGILILFKTSNIDSKIRKKFNFYTPEVNYEYFRDIPSNLDPIFAASLAFCKDSSHKNNKDEYASVLLSLARKKYIDLHKISEVEDWKSKNVKLVINTKIDSAENSTPVEPLSASEQLYLNLVKRYCTNDEISLDDLQQKLFADYQNADSFVSSMEKIPVNVGVAGNYFQKADYNEPKNNLIGKAIFYIVLGILFITIVNFASHFTRYDYAFGGYTILGIILIFCGYSLKKKSKNYVLLTQFGEDEYSKWRGLYNFLNSETLMNERTVVELPLWEQYLVYATAFGISDKVIKAINLRCPNFDDSRLLSNPYYRSHAFYSHSRSITSSTHYASSVARSGGFGGHGGYGGGGRGGGGGGGGH